MPRRYVDYPDAFANFNMISTYGSYISFVGVLIFVFVAIRTLTIGKRVGANYWNIENPTLEWTLPSPPPFHQFEKLPRIK